MLLKEKRSYDVVICSEVLEHVADPHALLAAIGERLSPQGLLVLTTPNLDGVHEGAAPGDLVRALSPGLHLVLYDSALLARRRMLRTGWAISAGSSSPEATWYRSGWKVL